MCALSWLITKIILRCTVSKTSTHESDYHTMFCITYYIMFVKLYY